MGGNAGPRTTVGVGCAQVRHELWGVSLTGSPGSAERVTGQSQA